jgi:hypothetical protein
MRQILGDETNVYLLASSYMAKSGYGLRTSSIIVEAQCVVIHRGWLLSV